MPHETYLFDEQQGKINKTNGGNKTKIQCKYTVQVKIYFYKIETLWYIIFSSQCLF